MTMDDKKVPKSAKFYKCEKCDFKCFKEFEWNRHITTSKHKKNDIELQESANPNLFICNCGKEYKFRQGLWKHKKKCNQIKSDEPNNKIITEQENNIISPELILNIIQQNQEFKNLLIEQNKTIVELSKNNNTTNKRVLYQV